MSKLKSISTKNKLVIGIVVFLVIVFVVLEKTHITNFTDLSKKGPTAQQDNSPSPEQKKQETDADAAAKKQFIENSGTDPSGSNTASASNIELSARKETNGSITVLTKLTSYANGECELTITNGNRTSSRKATVIYQPEFSSCAGFNIPMDELGTGTWTIKLSVTSNGSSNSKTITFEVK